MSQKFIKTQNRNEYNPKSYGKYYATAVYDNHFIGTEELADFSSIGVDKKEDCTASTISTRRVLFLAADLLLSNEDLMENHVLYLLDKGPNDKGKIRMTRMNDNFMEKL